MKGMIVVLSVVNKFLAMPKTGDSSSSNVETVGAQRDAIFLFAKANQELMPV